MNKTNKWLNQKLSSHVEGFVAAIQEQELDTKDTNTGEIHYHKENKTNGGKQIEFSAESNQFEKKIKIGKK